MRRGFLSMTSIVLLCLVAVIPSSLFAATCGPDAFGYEWRDDESGALFENKPFVNPGSVTGNDAVAVSLGFPFYYYGTTYDTVYVTAYGWVSLVDPGMVELITACTPDRANPNAVIAPF